MTNQLSRDIAVTPSQTALLFIDVQNFGAHREGGEYSDCPEDLFEKKYGWFFRHFEAETLPNMQRLQAACRKAGVEVMYTVIESLTRDGRDRSLDYKITGFNVPRGSWDARVVDAIAPGEDEIVIPKTSSSVFISTNIDYVLRNLGVKQVIMSGLLTDQCVDSAVRDACDLGYLVTVATDACATHSLERHEASLRLNQGYCRQVTTDALIAELDKGAL